MSNKKFDFNKSGSFSPKKEKPVKVKKVKTPKAPKPVKVSAPKAFKAPKAPKEPKPIKVKAPKAFKAPKAPKTLNSAKEKKSFSLFNSKKKQVFDVSTSSNVTKSKAPKSIVKPLIIILSVLIVVVGIVILVVGITKYNNQIYTINVSSPPSDLEYFVGDPPNYDGLEIQVVKNNGKSYFVDKNECQISGFDTSKPADRKTVTVSYQGFTSTFKIKVLSLPPEVRELESIEFEVMPKTEYYVGEWLYTKGGVIIVRYTDGTYIRHNLVNDDIYNFVTDEKKGLYVTQNPGEYTLQIRYKEGSITKKLEYKINVTVKENTEETPGQTPGEATE